MSDESDETIDAGPDVLARLKAEAERRASSPDPSPTPQPAADPAAFEDDDTVSRVDPRAEHMPTAEPPPAQSEPALEPREPAGESANESAASAFVRDFRERAAAPVEEPAPTARSRRSGIWILLAVVVGAQIVAVGVYFSITALRDDPDTVELDVAADTAADADAQTTNTADVAPSPAATPTAELIAPTATVVPPTPTWRPVDGGPRRAPFTFIVEAIVNEPRFFDARDGQQIEPSVDGQVLPLRNPTASGDPLVLRVTGGEPGDEWIQVELPGNPDNDNPDNGDTFVWVRGEDFVWNSTTRLIQVDIATNTLIVFDENVAIFSAPVASGTRASPTPQISTYVIEEVGSLGEDGLRRIRLAGFGGERATSDGLGPLSIAIAVDPAAIRAEDGYVTAGSVLLTPNDYAQVADLIDAGARVEIFGTPTRPTPTPLPPTPTPLREPNQPGDSTDGFESCPPTTLGTPPNCYRVVDRVKVTGECGGSQVLIEDICYLLGGDPDVESSSCTANAPTLIRGLCYLQIGARPEIDGGCPPGAREVRGECREPA